MVAATDPVAPAVLPREVEYRDEKGVSKLVNTISGLESQGEVNRLLDELFGASDAVELKANPDEAGEVKIFVSDRDEGP